MPATLNGYRGSRPVAFLSRQVGAVGTDGASAALPPLVKRRLQEQVRAYGYSAGWHLNTPWSSLAQWRPTTADATGETAEMRRAYPEMCFREAAVKSPLLARVWEVGCLDLQVLPADKNNKRDREIAEGYKYALTHSSGGLGMLATTAEIGLAAAVVGHSLSEMSLKPDLETRGRWRDKRMVRAVKAKRPGTYSLVTDDYANFTGVRTPDLPKDAPPFPADRFIHYPWLTLYADVQGVSDLRAAWRAFCQMDAATKLRAFFHDKLSGGFAWLEGVSSNRAEAAGAVLKEMRGCGYAVFEEGEVLHMAEIATGGTAAFQAYIEDLRKEMMMSVAGSHLPFTEGVNTNVAGSSEVQRQVSTLGAWVLAAAIGGLLTEAAHLWVDENYANADLPTVRLGGIDPAERDRYVERAVKAKTAGIPTSAEDFHEQSGLPPPKDGGDVLGGGVLGGPQGGGPPGGQPPGTVPGQPQGAVPGQPGQRGGLPGLPRLPNLPKLPAGGVANA